MTFGNGGTSLAVGMVLQMAGQGGSAIQAEVFEADGNRWIETLQTWRPEDGDAPRFYGWTSDVGIDRISLLSAGDATRPEIYIDDVQYSAISAVPIPAAVWLFGSGLVGLVAMARRRH